MKNLIKWIRKNDYRLEIYYLPKLNCRKKWNANLTPYIMGYTEFFANGYNLTQVINKLWRRIQKKEK